MAAVPITINGVLCDKFGRTIQSVMIMGEATITGLTIGGGPIIPPEGGGEQPPGGDITKPGGGWGAAGPGFPTNPIPIYPGGTPDPPGKPEEPIQPPVEWKAIWIPPPPSGGDGYWAIVGVPQGEHVTPSR